MNFFTLRYLAVEMEMKPVLAAGDVFHIDTAPCGNSILAKMHNTGFR